MRPSTRQAVRKRARSAGVFLLAALALSPAAAEPTLEEKAGQLLIISAGADTSARAIKAAQAGLGGVQLQWGSYSLEETRRLTERLQAAAARSAEKTPLFIAVDYEGGSVYVPTTLGLLELPTNMMLGAADDENGTATLFYLAGKELRRAGINMAFGPVLDVNTNPKNPIIGIRSLGSDPVKTARLGAAILNGFKASGVIAVAKHFPGHGAAEKDSHKTLPEISLSTAELHATHLLPFRTAAAAGVPAIMTAHIRYPALDKDNPATLSRAVLAGLLKMEMGYRGLVVTDSLDMRAITQRLSVPRAAAAALKAGADILLIGTGDPRAAAREIARQVRAGEINETRLNDAYYRVLEAKRAAGLYGPPETPSPFDKAYLEITGSLSRQAATLVRDTGLIPLPKDKRIAVIIFSPQRFAGNALSLYKVLRESGYQASQYFFDIGVSNAELRKLTAAAAEADVLVLGSFQWTGAQNASQRDAINILVNYGKPAVLLSLMNPYDIAAYPGASAVLALYGMTAPSLAAAGEILAGQLAPAGTLPVELPK
ncbi:MAG: glycoside hydrolase family 3 N-terminal domain-containing protein [Elusimicrobiales bacterium]|nr:glycoside hydrolase family 3 N-terminal domain-containing protein [Elusimicrobiales bacterium]